MATTAKGFRGRLEAAKRKRRLTIEPHFSVGFVAQMLDLDRKTVRQRVEVGEFGPYLTGPEGIRIPLSGVQRYMEARRVDPNQEAGE